MDDVNLPVCSELPASDKAVMASTLWWRITITWEMLWKLEDRIEEIHLHLEAGRWHGEFAVLIDRDSACEYVIFVGNQERAEELQVWLKLAHDVPAQVKQNDPRCDSMCP